MSKPRQKVLDELKNYKESHKETILTNRHGAPVGPQDLFTDPHILAEDIESFNMERMPERVAHARGSGAFGFFEVTNDITGFCRASLFNQIGKRTPIAIRFSTTAGQVGSSETIRDTRGFAVKFYTEGGNWDVVGNNQPVFSLKDPILFPSLMHAQTRNACTNLTDKNAYWDFATLRPETTHLVILAHTDRGIPDGYRHQNGHGINTFQLVNRDRNPVLCKFHFMTNQGIKTLSEKKAEELKDPDYATRDLYNSLLNGQFPSWTLYIQAMTYEQAKNFRWNPLDPTKIWPHQDFPLIKVGQCVLDRMPKNFFADMDQLAFSPDNLVDGIEATQDLILQARMFAYPNAQRYRLGINFDRLPVNAPYRAAVHDYRRDGAMVYTDNGDGAPNFFPNSFGGPMPNAKFNFVHVTFTPDPAKEDDHFSQATVFWTKVLNEEGRKTLVRNLATSLLETYDFIQDRAIKNFSQVHPDLGQQLKEAIYKKSQANL